MHDAQEQGYGTPYLEAEALLAIQDGNTELAREKLGGMFPSERQALRVAARTLYWMLDPERSGEQFQHSGPATSYRMPEAAE